MSFPASLTTRIVKGRFVTYPGGVPAVGTARFILKDFIQGPNDDTFVAPFDITVPFDKDGSFSIVLPATDDPDWTHVFYRVIIRAGGKILRQKLAVPYDSEAPVDLAEVFNVPSPTPGENYILLATKGRPNGVASLGSDGKVPTSQLPAGNGGTSGVAYIWDGTAYVLSASTLYVGPVNPLDVGSPLAGSFWYVTDDVVDGGGGGGDVITAGQRVTNKNQVGYLGTAHDSAHTLNVGDAIPSALSAWHWDDAVFRLNAGNDNYTLDGWTINAGIDCYAANLTVKNCVITPGEATAFYGVLGRAGTLTVQDTKITGAGGIGESGQCISLDSGGVLTVLRCDLSGFQDAIGIQNGLISQVAIHDIALAGSFHSDGIQIFGGGTSGTIIQHSLIDITGPNGASTDNSHQNACIYTDAPSGPTTGLVVNNCQLNGGAYEMILSAAPQDVHVTNCNFGPVDSSGLGTVTVTTGTQIVEWTNNHDSTNTLIAQPSA